MRLLDTLDARIGEALALLRQIRDALAPEPETRRIAPGLSRPLGPDNFLRTSEMARELPYSERDIEETLTRFAAEVDRVSTPYGKGAITKYRWGDASRVLVRELGSPAHAATREDEVQAPPMPSAVDFARRRRR